MDNVQKKKIIKTLWFIYFNSVALKHGLITKEQSDQILFQINETGNCK